MSAAVASRERAKSLLWIAALGLALVVSVSAAAVLSYVKAHRLVDHTLEVRLRADEWMVTLLSAETGAHGYLLSSKPAYLEPYATALQREPQIAAQLAALVADNAEQTRNVHQARIHAAAALDELRQLVAAVRAGQGDAAVASGALGRSKHLIDDFQRDWRRVSAEESRLLVERRARAEYHASAALLGALVLAVLSFGLLVFARRLELTRERAVEQLASEARARLQGLSELAVALSKARARTEVAAVVIEQGMRIARADTCTLYLLDAEGSTLELLAARGVAEKILKKVRSIPTASVTGGTGQDLSSGSALWVENEREYAAIFPALARAEAEGPRAKAFWSVPLVVEGRSVGLLGMGFYEPRTFPSDERMLVHTLAQQCGQALLRALHVEGEDEARRWLATTLRSIGDAVIATEARGEVTFMNPVAEALTGWTEQDARGRPLEEVFRIYSEHTGAVVESPVTKVLREGTVVGLANHTVLRSRQGATVPIDDSGAPIRNESGEISGVVLVFRDASREKLAYARQEFLTSAGEALISSLDYRQTLATVTERAVPTIADWCAVDLLEPGARVPARAAVAHIDPDKVEFARKLNDRYPSDPSSKAGAAEVIRSGRSQLYAEIPPGLLEAAAVDAEHLRLIRELRLESAMVVPLRGRARTLGAMTFVYAESGRRYTPDDLAFAEEFARRAALAIENAIALREAEEARAEERALRAAAESGNRAKDEFLAMVSHELRTPLNAILGWTVTLRRRAPPAEIDRGLAIVERNARFQAKLIEDVLDVSRIISGKLALSLGPTNVAEAVTASIETVLPAAEAKGLAISKQIAGDALTILADADRIQQIVWNLLSNAVKFTPKGGSISVHSYREGSHVCICVADTGEGIRPEALPAVFEPFRQADASTTRRHGGLGLGLTIVKQLVDAHGGTVHASSEGENRGAKFVVQLPARAAVPATARAPRPNLGAAEQARAHEAMPRLDGVRVVVVDDEEDARTLVAEVLREQGADTHLAGSAPEALRLFGAVRPDVLVSDIGMPEEDGYSLIQKIRALPVTLGGTTPAVALTAYARSEDAERALAAGYQRHVAKPVEPAELVTLVASLAGRG